MVYESTWNDERMLTTRECVISVGKSTGMNRCLAQEDVNHTYVDLTSPNEGEAGDHVSRLPVGIQEGAWLEVEDRASWGNADQAGG